MRDMKKVNSRTVFSCFLSNLKVLKNHEGILMEVYWLDFFFFWSGNVFEICEIRDREFEKRNLEGSAF